MSSMSVQIMDSSDNLINDWLCEHFGTVSTDLFLVKDLVFKGLLDQFSQVCALDVSGFCPNLSFQQAHKQT